MANNGLKDCETHLIVECWASLTVVKLIGKSTIETIEFWTGEWTLICLI